MTHSSTSSTPQRLASLLAAHIGWVIAVCSFSLTGAAILIVIRAVSLQPDPPSLRSAPVTMTSEAPDGSWPNLFGPYHNGVAQVSAGGIQDDWGDEAPPLAWEYECGLGYSSPIAWGERVLLYHRVEDQEHLTCLSLHDGGLLWEQTWPTEYDCPNPSYTDGPYSTPATDGRRVYLLSPDGKLRCVDFDAGRPRWERDLQTEYLIPDGHFGIGHSPLIWRDLLILNVGGTREDSGIVAFEKETGAEVWRATNDRASYATPMPARIHGRDYLFVLTAQGLVSLNPQQGQVDWSIPFESRVVDGHTAVTPLVYGDHVLVTVYGPGTLCVRVEPEGGYTELWRESLRPTFVSQYTPLLCVDGYVYGSHHFDKSFRCIDLASGSLMWRWKGSLVQSTHLVAGERLILYDDRGRLACLEVNPREAIVRSVMAEPLFDEGHCFSAPALARNRLLVRNEQRLLCLDLSPSHSADGSSTGPAVRSGSGTDR